MLVCLDYMTYSSSQARQGISEHYQSHLIPEPLRESLSTKIKLYIPTTSFFKGMLEHDNYTSGIHSTLLFTRAHSDRTKSNGFNLKEDNFRLDIRNKFFTVSMMRHCNRTPREVVDLPSLEMFTARLDGLVEGVPTHP